MKLLLSLITVVLVGCSSVSVHPKFPEAPISITKNCPELIQTENTTKISEVLSVVVENYGEYYDCANKVQLWNEWYLKNKEIFKQLK